MNWHAGVIGTGQWSRVHLEALSASPHISRITLAGRNVAAREALAAGFASVHRTVDRAEDLYDDESIALIHVVVPHAMHSQIARQSLSAGKHVICEKPAATRLADFDEIVSIAQHHERRLLVVLNQLYNPLVRRVRQVVDEGALGRVFLSVENAYSNAAANYRDPLAWRTSIDRAGGGILIDGGYHMVYRHLHYLAAYGTPRHVRAETAQLAVDSDGVIVPTKGEDFVSITVGYDEPLRIAWSHAWTLTEPPMRNRQYFLAGTEGTLELTDETQTPLILRREDRSDTITVDEGPKSPADSTKTCLLDYIDCVATGRDPENASLGLARTALSVILAAYESGRTGRKVALDQIL